MLEMREGGGGTDRIFVHDDGNIVVVLLVAVLRSGYTGCLQW